MNNYAQYARKAREKISRYGSSCELVRTGKKYNPETNGYDEETVSEGFALQSTYGDRAVDGTNIKYGDILLMCVLDEKPLIGDSVRFGGNQYTVVNVTEFAPDGKTVIYYKIQAR